MTNKQVYTSSENLDRIQESSRTAFELMSRDLREANGNPCSNEINPLSNGLNNHTTYRWWSTWGAGSTANDAGAGLQGYTGDEAFPDAGFGEDEGDRVEGTPAIEVWNAMPVDIVVNTSMGSASDPVPVTDTTGKGVAANDILVICDYNHGAVFQATKVNATSIEHGTSGTPGNTSADLPPSVYGPDSSYADRFAYISKMHASRWYIGYNGRHDRDGNKLTSLYRTAFNGTTLDPSADEIVDGVTDMDLAYHVTNGSTYDEVPASWTTVDAISIHLYLAGRDKAGTDQQAIKRDYKHVVAIRSRAP
jgi:type IV pilus assembly protein PilW